MNDPPARIDATAIVHLRLSQDRTRVVMVVRDEGGHDVQVSLPAACLGAVLSALPAQIDPNELNALDSWSLEATPSGKDLILTLRTGDGRCVAFAAKPSQMQGMATLASWGFPRSPADKMVH